MAGERENVEYSWIGESGNRGMISRSIIPVCINDCFVEGKKACIIRETCRFPKMQFYPSVRDKGRNDESK